MLVTLQFFLFVLFARLDADLSSLVEKAQTIGPTGGKPCSKTSSRTSKVRINDGSLFVAAFCQSNVGDVSPNVLGAFCTDTGKPCDFNRSSCHGDDTLCVGRGPGYYLIASEIRRSSLGISLVVCGGCEIARKLLSLN